MIILNLPVAAQRKFNLYENLVLPKVDNKQVVSLVGIPKFFAIHNGTHYFENDTLSNCVMIHRQVICKDAIVRILAVCLIYTRAVLIVFANIKDMINRIS